MQTQEVLVIVLAAALAVFVILAVVVAIQLIRILRHVEHISQRAEGVADDIASASSKIRSSIKPVAIMSTISEVIGKLFNLKKKRGKRK